jgi:hypothetical protein
MIIILVILLCLIVISIYYLSEYYIGNIDVLKNSIINNRKKLAICISGQFRDIDICMKNHSILKQLNADIFIYADDNLNEKEKNKIISYYNPLYCIWDNNKIEPIDNYNYSMVRMFNRIYMCDMLRVIYENNTVNKYDVVIRMRPDLIFPENIPLKYINNVKPNSIYIPNQRFNTTMNQLNDQFAIGDSNSMMKYAECYKFMLYNTDTKSQCTGEKILYNYIRNNNLLDIYHIPYIPIVYSLKSNNLIDFTYKLIQKDFVSPSNLYNCYIK